MIELPRNRGNITVEEAAEIFSTTPGHVLTLAKTGKIRAFMVDDQPRIITTSMQEYAEAHKLRKPRSKAKKRFIYFVRVAPAGPIKIGSSDALALRFRQLQGANHEELLFLGAYEGSLSMEFSVVGQFHFDSSNPISSSRLQT